MWDKLNTMGSQYGYHLNIGKTQLVIKPGHLQAAEMHFQSTGVKITTCGQRQVKASCAKGTTMNLLRKLSKPKQIQWSK